jgi:hypothetical protein
MQPIQHVVEQLVARNLTAETALRLAQIGINMFGKLFFGDFGWNFAHDRILSPLVWLFVPGSLHHASKALACQFFSSPKTSVE